MKVGFLNPWSNAAESQACMSQVIAARKIGLELIACKDESELESSRVDFVISVASSVPKVCDYPTYLNVHEPTARFLGNAFYLNNLMTYDGYLTISDSLYRFLRDLSFGIGRPGEPGFYFDTPQKSEVYADIPQTVRDGTLKIVYFGTNWDRRSPKLFDLLDTNGIIRIHGPTHSWSTALKSYAGPIPFDGTSPQIAYASFGIGLVLLSTDHLREDVISNRIFEISSVGAVSICPDIPWIRKWFGDSVFYFDPIQPTKNIVSEIINIHEYCRTDPFIAAKMGRRAQAIFEQHFTAELMLSNAVEYHETKQRYRLRKRQALGTSPLIAVIIRCGGRQLDFVERAISSIAKQTFGRYALILVKYKNIDLSPVVARRLGSNIETITELDVPNGNRSATLFAGLATVRELASEYFAVLDDDDFWLSNHIENLFCAAKQARPTPDVVFSGSIAMESEPRKIEESIYWKRNVYTFGYRGDIHSLADVVREFTSNCFVARTDALPNEIDFPDMETAEDSFLIGLVARFQKPVFSFSATAFFKHDARDGSRFAKHPQRKRDEASLLLRSELFYCPAWLNHGSVAMVLGQQNRVAITASPRVDEHSVLFDGTPASSTNPINQPETFEGRQLYFSRVRTHLRGGSRFISGSDAKIVQVLPPLEPWAYGAEFDIRGLLAESDQFVVAEFGTVAGSGYIGLLDAGGNFIERVEVPNHKRSVEIWLPTSEPLNVWHLVIQNGELPLQQPIEVSRIWFGRHSDERDDPQWRSLINRKAILLNGAFVSSEYSINALEYFDARLFPFCGERAHVWGDSRVIFDGDVSSIQVLPPPNPWAYGLEIGLRGLLVESDQFVIAELGTVAGSGYIGLLDAQGDFIERVEIPNHTQSVEVWLPTIRPLDVHRLVIQNGEQPLQQPIEVFRIWFGREALDRHDPQERLAAAQRIVKERLEQEPMLSFEQDEAVRILASASLDGLYTQSYWVGATIIPGQPAVVETTRVPWGYSAILPLSDLRQNKMGNGFALFWEIEIQVRSGEVGLALIHDEALVAEKVLDTLGRRIKVYLPAVIPDADLLIRNGSNEGASSVAVYGVYLVQVRDPSERSSDRGGETQFLRKFAGRGLRGVKLVISYAHEGIKAAVAKLSHGKW